MCQTDHWLQKTQMRSDYGYRESKWREITEDRPMKEYAPDAMDDVRLVSPKASTPRSERGEGVAARIDGLKDSGQSAR